MIKNVFYYVFFIGAYLWIYFAMVLVPIEFEIETIMVSGFAGMVLTFRLINRRENFNGALFYSINLIFVFLLSAITVLYEKLFSLPEIYHDGNTTVEVYSSLFDNTLSINHSIIFSTLIVLIHSIFKWNLIAILIPLATLGFLVVYYTVLNW